MWQRQTTSSRHTRCATLNLVERQDPLDFLQVLLGDLQGLLLGQAALTRQTGAKQQLGAVVHLNSQKKQSACEVAADTRYWVLQLLV